MLKEIVGDYFRRFHIENMKELLKTNTVVLVSVVYPLIVWLVMAGDAGEDRAVFLLIYLPILYILLSFYAHPVTMPKMLYLCPMGADRRRRYIRYSYYFKVGVQMTVAIVGTVFLMACTGCDVLSVTEILLSDFILSILIPPKKKKDECCGNFDRESVYMTCMIAISVLSNLGQMVAVSDKEPHKILQIVILVCFVAIQIPLTVQYLKYVKRELEAAVYYEETENL